MDLWTYTYPPKPPFFLEDKAATFPPLFPILSEWAPLSEIPKRRINKSFNLKDCKKRQLCLSP